MCIQRALGNALRLCPREHIIDPLGQQSFGLGELGGDGGAGAGGGGKLRIQPGHDLPLARERRERKLQRKQGIQLDGTLPDPTIAEVLEDLAAPLMIQPAREVTRIEFLRCRPKSGEMVAENDRLRVAGKEGGFPDEFGAVGVVE
jgi:hypothetical protein